MLPMVALFLQDVSGIKQSRDINFSLPVDHHHRGFIRTQPRLGIPGGNVLSSSTTTYQQQSKQQQRAQGTPDAKRLETRRYYHEGHRDRHRQHDHDDAGEDRECHHGFHELEATQTSVVVVVVAEKRRRLSWLVTQRRHRRFFRSDRWLRLVDDIHRRRMRVCVKIFIVLGFYTDR